LLPSASAMANALATHYPVPSVALLSDYWWWWQSGSAVDALLTFSHVSGSQQYTDLLANTLLSQATSTNDFMTVHATGNDDQAWWALAALTAAENGVPERGVPWTTLAQNVFDEQRERWDEDRCNGGMKWKVVEGDDGWHYKSSIANGLFFQLAARLAAATQSEEALEWADKAYEWVVSVGLIDPEYNVFDGTDDAKETGCVDVNHIQWSYNVGVFMYGSAVMAAHTRSELWTNRTRGFIESAKRNFIKDGRLFEQQCEGKEGDEACNVDQVSFKGTLARWLGATAALLPEVERDARFVINEAVNAVQEEWSAADEDVMAHFSALEVVDAGMRANGMQVGGSGMIGAEKVGRRG
ncbi:glycoside hydrolase, partial [Corynespora cassiicola Philippines]